MVGHKEPREPVNVGGQQQQGPQCQACLPDLLTAVLNLSRPWGGAGEALFSLEWPCYFQMGFFPSLVVSSLLPSFPALPSQRVVIAGLLCLWWAGQWPCL